MLQSLSLINTFLPISRANILKKKIFDLVFHRYPQGEQRKQTDHKCANPTIDARTSLHPGASWAPDSMCKPRSWATHTAELKVACQSSRQARPMSTWKRICYDTTREWSPSGGTAAVSIRNSILNQLMACPGQQVRELRI